MKAKRASLTKRERAALALLQGGLCATWGCVGKPEIGEHFTPVALGNAAKPDCLLCKPCAKAKTRKDIAAIAKVKRIRNGKTQADKRAAAGGSRIRGKTKIESKGFEGHRKFNGEIVRRDR